MSPSESQLRAALSDGEGDGVSVEAIVSRAAQVRRERRVRYASIAGAAVLVAGLSTAGALGFAGNTRSSSGAASSQTAIGATANASSRRAEPQRPFNGPNQPGSADAAPAPAAGLGSATAGTSLGAVTNAGTSSASAAGCPAPLPPITVPRSGSGDFFTGPLDAMRLCQYSESGGVLLHSTAIGSALGRQVVASLDAAPRTRPALACPAYRSADGQILLMIGIGGPNGTAMRPVSAHIFQNTCGQPVTDGVAVRFDWQPPAGLSALLIK